MLKLTDLNSHFVPIADRWGTHVNLLRSVGAGIKSVLELGMGTNSTPLFLDRAYYPDLTELCSVESDPAWVEMCRTDDPRHKVATVPEPIEPFLGMVNWNSVDLIFLDNSSSHERRIDTIRYISALDSRALVVMHDYDYAPYREAVSGFNFVLVDDRQEPWTALLCR